MIGICNVYLGERMVIGKPINAADLGDLSIQLLDPGFEVLNDAERRLQRDVDRIRHGLVETEHYENKTS